MSVRPATTDDIDALLPLLRGYCEFYEADPSDEGLIEMCRALIAAPDDEGLLLVAESDGGAVAGFAACGWKWSSLRGARITVMEDLFVAPDQRGGGLGVDLIRACAERSAELGAPAMEWMTAPDNRRAQAAYARAGGESEPFLVYELKLSGSD